VFVGSAPPVPPPISTGQARQRSDDRFQRQPRSPADLVELELRRRHELDAREPEQDLRTGQRYTVTLPPHSMAAMSQRDGDRHAARAGTILRRFVHTTVARVGRRRHLWHVPLEGPVANFTVGIGLGTLDAAYCGSNRAAILDSASGQTWT